jgi:asparagine synthase (glutamine-hydrolysing)
MCGILGVYGYKGAPVDPLAVLRAAGTLKHRGPDDEGYLLVHTPTLRRELRSGPDTPANIPHPRVEQPVDFAPDLILGHRRLSIIDLSPGGHEPLTTVDQNLWLTFNGELYNYLEIRAELQSMGYRFHTEGDGEVILQAYNAWGMDCLKRFIGMFAFAIWDERARRLWCVRDQLGIKPFYYAATPDYFGFASEIKALRALFPDACRPDEDALLWYLVFGYTHNAPRTFFAGVRELPGGHYLTVENGAVSEPIKYWDVDLERSRTTYNYADPEGEFLRLMRDSVRLQLRSDVPVGTCLSGGLDSSTIVALATEQLNGGRMNSFSSVYPFKGYDERRYIDLVANACNTIRHETSPTPVNFYKRMSDITWHQDIPTGDASVYSQSFVMELAHGNVTVLLDGQGSDELFAGYLGYVTAHIALLRKRDPIRWLKEGAQFMLEARSRFKTALNTREFAYRVWRYLIRDRAGRPSVLLPELAERGRAYAATVPQRDLAGADDLNKLLYLSVVRDSIPALLHYEDRNSMAYSIEARVPFLDHRMVEFALGVHGDLKVKGAETKVFMRRALKGILPDEVVQRRDKLGYPTPYTVWTRHELADETRAWLFDRVLKRGWYDRAQIETIWKQHSEGLRNFGNLIHCLIALEMWHERCAS